jgi:hypothetical protein
VLVVLGGRVGHELARHLRLPGALQALAAGRPMAGRLHLVGSPAEGAELVVSARS